MLYYDKVYEVVFIFICNLYFTFCNPYFTFWKQKENELSKYAKIERNVSQTCFFSRVLFNFYNQIILRELGFLTGFITGKHNIKYADDTMLIADTKKKLHEHTEKVGKESEKKGLINTFKKTQCKVVSTRNIPRCELWIGITKNNQVRRFKYLGSDLTNGVTRYTKIWRPLE